MFKVFNSARSIALIILVLGLFIGLLMGKISDVIFKEAAMIALVGYFSKRNDKGE